MPRPDIDTRQTADSAFGATTSTPAAQPRVPTTNTTRPAP